MDGHRPRTPALSTGSWVTRSSTARTWKGRPEHIEVRSSGLTIGIVSIRVANDEFGLGVVTGSNSAEVLLWCEDIDAAYAAALAAGGTPVHEPEDYQGGRVRHAWLTDPAGHLVALVEMRRP